MCLMSLTLIARLVTRHDLYKENLIIMIAATLSIAQSVLTHIAVDYGLGRHRAQIGTAQYHIYSKARYACQILEIMILCLAKISLVVVFMHLTPSRPAGIALRLFTASITFWGLAAIFALLFQCQRPDTWDLTPSKCYNQDIIYYTNGIINILTDVMTLMLPVIILWNVQITRKRKVAVFIIFAVRILVCIATLGQIITLKGYLHSTDRTWLDVNLSIWTQVMLGLSIITACIPLMKPFLEKLQFSLVDSSVSFKPAEWLRLQSRDRNLPSSA